MGQGPTEPHAGRRTFLLSSGGAGGAYYWVALDTGPIPTENQFPCRTLVTGLITKFFLRQRVKFIKGARTWRSISGTQLILASEPPPPRPLSLPRVSYQPATKPRPGRAFRAPLPPQRGPGQASHEGAVQATPQGRWTPLGPGNAEWTVQTDNTRQDTSCGGGRLRGSWECGSGRPPLSPSRPPNLRQRGTAVFSPPQCTFGKLPFLLLKICV